MSSFVAIISPPPKPKTFSPFSPQRICGIFAIFDIRPRRTIRGQFPALRDATKELVRSGKVVQVINENFSLFIVQIRPLFKKKRPQCFVVSNCWREIFVLETLLAIIGGLEELDIPFTKKKKVVLAS